MILPFFKMQSCGNDYIFFDLLRPGISERISGVSLPRLAARISDRHTGVGGDGLVLLRPSDTSDAFMQMFNADGSEGRMCGNALRCAGRYLRRISGDERDRFSVDTLSGVRYVRVPADDAAPVAAEMGQASFDPRTLPVPSAARPLIGEKIITKDGIWCLTALSVGNPHCVLFDRDQTLPYIATVGNALNACGLFAEGVNVSTVEIIEANRLNIRVWERGSGETQACGTAACAAVAAAVKNGYCSENTDVRCQMRGGMLTVRCQADGILLTGNADYVFRGEYEYAD